MSERKILLVQAWLGRKQHYYPFPIGLAAIAARLTGEHEVKGFDPNVSDDPMGELAALVEKFAPDVIGVSLRNVDSTNFFDPHLFYKPFEEMVRVARRHAPKSVIIAGGSGFSLFPQTLMARLPEIDLCVYLEGDLTMAGLIENLDRPAETPGVYYRENGALAYSGERPLEPFCEDWPLPAWDIFDLEPYKRIPYSMGVETKRGCAYRCAYCCYYILNGTRYRLKPVPMVLREIHELSRRGFKDIHFTDSVFNTPLPHAMEILRAMRAELPDMKWNAYLSPQGLTDEFVGLSLEMGMTLFGCSPDAYGDEALAAMGKGMRVDDIDRAVEVIRRHPPAEFGANFFVNGPGYTYKTLFDILKFALRAKRKLGRRYRLLKLIKAGYIRIEPGTLIEGIARSEGVIAPDNDLFPEDLDQFGGVFYCNKNLRAFNALYKPLKLMARRLHVLLFRQGRNS